MRSGQPGKGTLRFWRTASGVIFLKMRPWCVFLFLLALTAAPLAEAYQLSSSKWTTPAATFYVEIPGASGLWNTAFEEAMASWSSDTVFQYQIVRGSYSDPCDRNDNHNGVGFSATDCGDAWGSGTLAITITWFSGTTNTETDIVFNSNESWDVYDTPWQPHLSDFRRVAVHELGHALGLDHEDSIPATIMGTYAGDITLPQPDDINGVAALYGAATAVAAPATLTVPSGAADGSYTVAWTASATSGASYTVEEATDLLFTTDLRTAYSGSATSATITGRSRGVTYYYRVQASKSGASTSSWTVGGNGCLVAIAVADAPLIGFVVAGNGQATISFSAPGANGGSAITGYTATSSPGGIIASGTTSPITITGLSNGTAYTFTITASNAAGSSAPSLASNSVTPWAEAFNRRSSLEWINMAYLTYYGRAADPAGLTYWANRLDAAGGDLNSIIDAFGNSREFNNRFGTLSNEQLLDNVYQQMFNRLPDPSGKAFYLAKLNAGEMTLQSITINVLNGAAGGDKNILNNKYTIASSFSDHLRTTNKSYGSIDNVRNIISGIDGSSTSVVDAAENASTLLSQL